MKKLALIIALFMLLTAVSSAGIPQDDKDFLAGLKSYNSKNYSSAVKHFKEYISRKPDPTAYYLAGYSLYKLGKFSEADDYFRDAYLIDPEFSLEKVGLIKKSSGEVVAKEAASPKKNESADEKKETKQVSVNAAKSEVKESAVKKPAQPAPLDQKATAPAKTPAPVSVPKSAPAAQPAPQAVPAPAAPALPAVPPAQPPKMQIPDAAGPAALIGIIAAMGMIIVVIALAVYIYYCLCMFLIAKKLEVPAPWTAWIPLVQVWTFVASAGKPGWWIVLLLVPLVNVVVAIYLWMCITENLGKNKWLGLLVLVPLVGFIYPGWLAFSKSESSGGYTPPQETLSE